MNGRPNPDESEFAVGRDDERSNAVTPLLRAALAPEQLPAALEQRIRRELDARMRPARPHLIWRISWSSMAAAAAVALYLSIPPRTDLPRGVHAVAFGSASRIDWDSAIELDAALYGAGAQVDAALADAERLQAEVAAGGSDSENTREPAQRPDTR